MTAAATDDEAWDDTTPPTPITVYTSVESFVTDHLAPRIQRRLQGPVTWCPQWWRHPEAVDRLTALWKAWEHLHNTPGDGLSNWWLQHADPHLAVLLAADRGPFVWCNPDKGHNDRYQPLPELPHRQPLPG